MVGTPAFGRTGELTIIGARWRTLRLARPLHTGADGVGTAVGGGIAGRLDRMAGRAPPCTARTQQQSPADAHQEHDRQVSVGTAAWRGSRSICRKSGGYGVVPGR